MIRLRRSLSAGFFVAVAMAIAMAATPVAAQAPPLPTAVAEEFPGLRPLGSARLDVFLFHVYDASLWSTSAAWAPEGNFALDIRYARDVKGSDLTARSLEEMQRLGYRDARLLARWRSAMARVFPDIRRGDRLVGVQVGGREARFYNQQGLIGVIADAEFARAFFAIWLDERTREPAMRRKLLGLGE